MKSIHIELMEIPEKKSRKGIKTYAGARQKWLLSIPIGNTEPFKKSNLNSLIAAIKSLKGKAEYTVDDLNVTRTA